MNLSPLPEFPRPNFIAEFVKYCKKPKQYKNKTNHGFGY